MKLITADKLRTKVNEVLKVRDYNDNLYRSYKEAIEKEIVIQIYDIYSKLDQYKNELYHHKLIGDNISIENDNYIRIYIYSIEGKLKDRYHDLESDINSFVKKLGYTNPDVKFMDFKDRDSFDIRIYLDY